MIANHRFYHAGTFPNALTVQKRQKTHGSMQCTSKNHQIQWYLPCKNSGLYRISMEFRLSHAILRPNGRLLSHSSRLLSHYRTKSTKNIKFRTIPAQNTKNCQNRPNNQKVTAVKKNEKTHFFSSLDTNWHRSLALIR